MPDYVHVLSTKEQHVILTEAVV